MLTNPKEVEFDEKVDNSIGEIAKRVAKARWNVIELKLKEKKLKHLLRDITKRRFKPIQLQETDREIIVWVDNKTIKGMRLVTFLKETDSEIKDNKFSGQIRYY